MVRLTLVIAVANAMLAIIYVLIYLVMRRTGYLADRPYVIIGNLRVDNWSDGALSLSFRIGNYGRSPCWLTRFHMQAYVGPVADRDLRHVASPRYRRSTGEPFGGVVPPVPHEPGTIQVSDSPGDTSLTTTRDEQVSVQRGDSFLFIHGFIQYRDIHRRWLLFQNNHRSCFGYRYIPNEANRFQGKQFLNIANDAYWHYT